MKKSILCIILAISMILPLAVTTSAYSVTARDFYMTTSDNPTLDFNITAYNSGSNYYIFLPNDVDSSNVVIRYNKSVSNVSGADWNSSVKTITCHGEGTITVNGKAFYIMQSSLPSLSISIDSGYSIDTIHQSKENKIRAHAEINGAGEYDLESLPIEYKTRGNSTFDFVKKPYQIKFDSKTDLFGMGKAKKWVLLANYIDGTMIRNKMMFDLGEEIGMPYIVQSVFIDLYVDGEYYGVYQLCEKVEIGSSRVDLTTDEGIIIEMDGANRDLSGEIYFKTKTTGKPIVYKEYNTDFEETEDPDTVAKVKEIRTFTENYINTLEAELYSEDPSWDVISSMIDVDSFINYFFITEFSCEYDATYASTFFYMDGPDDILHCGPLWDYDRIMGWNYGDERDTDSDFLKNIIDATEVTRVEWFKQLFRHPEFVQRANEIYEETIKPAFETEKVISMIDEYQETLMPSLRMNHVKFIVFHNVSYTVNELFDGTTDEYVEYTTDAIKNWIVERNTFLDSKYGINHPTLLYKAYYDGVAAAEYSGGSMTYDLGDMNSFSIRLEDSIFDGGIEYSASARSASFNWCADGAPLTASTVHNTFNGIKVRLTGNIANYFSVEYRVYRNGSWSAWAMDGKNAGATAGASYVKRIQIRLVEKKDVEYGAINFVNNAGGAPEAIKTIPGNAYSIADIPAPENYKFEGWYDNPEFEGEAITELCAPDGEITLYARMDYIYETGDLNGDYVIDIRDMFSMKLIIKFINDPTDAQRITADINGDGLINAADAFSLSLRVLYGEWV